jgi:hypothetical protein
MGARALLPVHRPERDFFSTAPVMALRFFAHLQIRALQIRALH